MICAMKKEYSAFLGIQLFYLEHRTLLGPPPLPFSENIRSFPFFLKEVSPLSLETLPICWFLKKKGDLCAYFRYLIVLGEEANKQSS